MYKFVNQAYKACYDDICAANLAAKRKLDHKIVLGTLKTLFFECRQRLNYCMIDELACPAMVRYERLIGEIAHTKVWQLTDARDNVLEWLKREIIKVDRERDPENPELQKWQSQMAELGLM